jgi:hypothetical protein
MVCSLSPMALRWGASSTRFCKSNQFLIRNPTGYSSRSIERAFDFNYSDRLRRDNPWLRKVDEHYLDIAERINTIAPFTFAIIDFEGLPPFDGSRDILTEMQAYGGGCLLPNNETWVGRTAGWIERSSGLRWLPPRQG